MARWDPNEKRGGGGSATPTPEFIALGGKIKERLLKN